MTLLSWIVEGACVLKLTFDLGDECPSCCEGLHSVEQWVGTDDLAQNTQHLT